MDSGAPGPTITASFTFGCGSPTVGFASDTGRIQEIHIKVVHALIELVERELYPESYGD